MMIVVGAWTEADSEGRPSSWAFLWPSAIFVAGMLLIVAVGSYVTVRKFDASANRFEQDIVQSGLAQRIGEVSRMSVPQVVWDDAVLHLNHPFDTQWAAENIGRYLWAIDGIERTFIVDPADRLELATDRGRVADAASYRPFSSVTGALLKSVRAAEQRRGVQPTLTAEGMIPPPIQATALARVERQLFVVTATLVQPDFGRARQRERSAPVVITAVLVDNAFLSAFARRYALDDLLITYAPGRLPPAPEFALRGIRGEILATVSWRDRAPGHTLLRRLLVPLLAICGLIGAAGTLLVRRNHRLASDLIKGETRTARLAYFDPLTELPNRIALYARLAAEIGKADTGDAALAIHSIDLDRLKEINDTFGPAAGDQLIEIAAKRLRQTAGERCYLARVSGDGFALLQPLADAGAAQLLAQHLCAAVAEPVELECGRLVSGCSIGVTLVTRPGLDPLEALRQAEMALHQAKERGRGGHCLFDAEMDEALTRRRLIEADLREAIGNDALTIAYQPQVDRDGTMTGVEALVRWCHPRHGDVSPALFIPIAEERGLIGALGMLVFKRAFCDAHKWNGLTIAINVSPVQLRSPNFTADLAALVSACDANPRQIELEITESLLVFDNPLVRRTLDDLRLMGFSIALDDFCTGYSSLSYLQKYPVNKVKIDRSFVSALGRDDGANALVSAIIVLARALGLAVIAEGVETESQRSLLSDAGCTAVQGFLFSRPVPAAAITEIFCSKGRHIALPSEAARLSTAAPEGGTHAAQTVASGPADHPSRPPPHPA